MSQHYPTTVLNAQAYSGTLGVAVHWVDLAFFVGAGAGLLGLLMTLLRENRELSGSQLWGLPLLLIVWGSLRRGRAASLTAKRS